MSQCRQWKNFIEVRRTRRLNQPTQKNINQTNKKPPKQQKNPPKQQQRIPQQQQETQQTQPQKSLQLFQPSAVSH